MARAWPSPASGRGDGPWLVVGFVARMQSGKQTAPFSDCIRATSGGGGLRRARGRRARQHVAGRQEAAVALRLAEVVRVFLAALVGDMAVDQGQLDRRVVALDHPHQAEHFHRRLGDGVQLGGQALGVDDHQVGAVADADIAGVHADEVGQLALTFNEMAEELQHADQMRRDMVANVSHELRTPVSALQAMVENMADGVIDPTPSNLESILNQTHRLSDLIAFLLDLSRMEAGAASLQIEMFNFADFLDETVEPLEIADAGHAHDIEMHVPDDIEMAGDQDRLRQLFTNIIANALKHSADNTTVLIEAHENKDFGTIVTNVVNFGSQIPQEARSDIFRRFVKGKTGPGTESGGTGLGLSIARWAAQLHGGSVRVVDDPRGADFEIILPKYHVTDDE